MGRVSPIDPIEGQGKLFTESYRDGLSDSALAALVLGPAVRFDVDPFAQIGSGYVERDPRRF